MTPQDLWKRFCDLHCDVPSIGLSLDISRMTLTDGELAGFEPALQRAYADMAGLEGGAMANLDEHRMVGHYWLRTPELAPTPEIVAEIRETLAAIKLFAVDIHAGRIKPPKAAKFTQVISIGIGGSALGPMFVADALGEPGADKMAMHFIDNTDPDGIARVLKRLEGRLPETLVLVISKSGGTPEPHNGMLVVADAFRRAGLAFPAQAVAITGAGSHLDKQAVGEKWLRRFPMWDWVGGRTSELAAVGLVPAALQGLDIDAVLEGAAACDAATRATDTRSNPAALLAMAWYHGAGGKGAKDMVVLPYKDRLLLLSRYLQQLVMESLGKRLNLKGERVDQGIAVYGNKGSTDQHAYVQQLRDGVNNFFAVFIRVLHDGGTDFDVEPGVTAGDYLHGFLVGTRRALFENDRQSVTITVQQADARSVGILIALFERAVGFYASLVGINAYHQPGVEAGKKAAAAVLALQAKIARALGDSPQSAEKIAAAIGASDEVETVFLVLEHLSANGRARSSADPPAIRTFAKSSK